MSRTFKARSEPRRGHIDFGRVPSPSWEDKSVIIVGAGPSLKGFDLKRLYDHGYVVAVNGAMHDLLFADAWATMDNAFIRDNETFLNEPGPELFIGAPSDDWCGDPPYPPKIGRATYLKLMKRPDNLLSVTPGELTQGCTSGFMALNFAFLKRARTIVLFGFDYSEKHGSHYCPDRYPPQDREHMWKAWVGHFDFVAPQLASAGVRVINACPDSAITVFERMTHEQALEALGKP
jgi:hypothetical protein